METRLCDPSGRMGAGPVNESRIAAFVGRNAGYYEREFDRLGAATGYVLTFNAAAAVLGPFWLATRQLWGWFWLFLILETLAVVQLSRGLFANLGADQYARALRLSQSAARRHAEAEDALASGASNAGALAESALTLENAARSAFHVAEAAAAGGPALVVLGIVLLAIAKLAQGLLANHALSRRYFRWCSDRSVEGGLRASSAAAMALYLGAIYGLSAFRFSSGDVPAWLEMFPASRAWRRNAESAIDQVFQWMTESWAGLFVGTTNGIRFLLDGMETLLVATPWPVVMGVIVLLAYRVAGARVAVFTAASLAYLGILGFWERSMTTVALLGTAALICLIAGIPLGIWCAHNRRVHAIVRPVLDLMQTMPSFVYLIPVIAFFGIGKPPGILATVVFGMPPVVRLTILGLNGVPTSVREAALAFGASRTHLLLKVDLPLAIPSIMTGINQTILMCLSMVVIASLIGAKGLGEEVLDALTYANEGKGVLAGLAILLCAMVLDRIVQGSIPSMKR